MKPCIACKTTTARIGKPYCSPCWSQIRVKAGKAPYRRPY